jgi:membrane protease YdiL (CAAX protease family)
MSNRRLIAASIVFAGSVLAIWGITRGHVEAFPEVSFSRAFAAFVLLFAPLWFFGFGAAESAKQMPAAAKIVAAGAFAFPYFVYALGTPAFNWRAAIIVVGFPMLLAAFLELPSLLPKMTWRDVVALAVIVAAYFLHWLRIAWPSWALALFPKLFLADVALYCFLVIRHIDGSTYSLVPTKSALRVGFREWLFYFPIALVLGRATSFIHFHPAFPRLGAVLTSILLTFLLVAIPEELFFRAILQNLLETRLGRTGALLVASLLFGLSHFNHGAGFNWRYVLLASVAGIFYGRACRAERQVFASIVTHTAVDVVWSLWFR